MRTTHKIFKHMVALTNTPQFVTFFPSKIKFNPIILLNLIGESKVLYVRNCKFCSIYRIYITDMHTYI